MVNLLIVVIKSLCRIHTGANLYKYKVCSKEFNQSCNLKTHNLIHTTDETLYECEVCGKQFNESVSN